jgi:small subunit ribosomal protein S1
MVSKKLVSDVGGEIPESVDEGWWAAVLSDEESILAQPKEITGKNLSPTAITVIDWAQAQQLFEQDEIINLRVHGFNRGGLLVQGENLQGFVPVSHLLDIPCDVDDEERRSILAGYVDRCIDLKVIECEPNQERIVLSERAALAGEGQRKVLFNSLSDGAVLTGKVTNVTEFGVFIDLGGVEGLIHVSELSWGRVQHPADILKVDDEVNVLVLHVCEENSRIALSLKRLHPNPWENLASCYQVGDLVTGWITSLTRYGAFARLENGVEGLIHISSIKLPAGCKSIENYLGINQQVSLRILHIDIERRRLGLGLVQLE